MKEQATDHSALVRVWARVIIRVFLTMAAVLVGIWLLYELYAVLLLLVIAIFFCYLIAPVVRIVEQPIYIGKREFKIPRGLDFVSDLPRSNSALLGFESIVSHPVPSTPNAPKSSSPILPLPGRV